MDKLLYTVPEVAEMVGLGRSKLYELIASGQIQTVRIGRSVRVPVDALRTFMDGLRLMGDVADSRSVR